METKILGSNIKDFEQEGLYLVFPDTSRMILTRDLIQKTTKEYWDDPEKISPKAKTAAEFQRCPFCPLKENSLCDALRPVLPLLDKTDKYVSYDKVIAVYKRDISKLFYACDTTMQEALKFISILSLMQYCQIGRTYWKYYFGIVPLMSGDEMARRMYKNIFFLTKGNAVETDKIITSFKGQIKITSTNQVKRLSLICKNDAFMNAFVNTQVVSELLSMNIAEHLKEKFDEFEKQIPR
ncbi:MAG: hypothetical protein PHH14_06755 [Candidatus Margulisbacteria bacterium]|nr:hypothetical protein [Candidatus Margulisiibacteriota bacterium]